MQKHQFQQMNSQFAAINQQFQRMDQRFESIDQRFQSIDQRFQDMDQRFDQVNQRFDQVDGRFEQMDEHFENVDERLEAVTHKLLEHDTRFENIEANMATKDDVNYLNNTLDRVVKDVADIKQENAFHLSWLRRQDGDIDLLKQAVL